MPDVDVVLLPHSRALLERLEDIKRRSRRDVRALRTSGRDIKDALRTEDAAGQALDPGLPARRERTDTDGAFVIDPVRAGTWVLVAWRSTFVAKHGEGLKPRDRQFHQPTPRLTGYHTMEIWVRSLEVSGGQSAQVELTDRNIWMTAIEEERTPEPAR
jgi:hypothetical protein